MDINYLSKVRGSIISDIVQVAKYHSEKGGTSAGWFSIPRQVFCIIDFLGSIAYNNDPQRREDGASTRKSVKFIKEFFPQHYKPYANLIVAIWRHGTVHNFISSTYFVMQGNRKTKIEWTSNRSNEIHNRVVNMKTFDKKGATDTIYLSINICQLGDDLLNAFDKFIKKIDNKLSFKSGCLRRLKRTLKMKNCMTLLRIGNNEKKNIKTTDSIS